MKLQNLKGEQSSITDALQLRLPQHAVISVTGAGGKTSLIFAWAKELAGAGKKVAVTTTTHMMSPELMRNEPVDLYGDIPSVICGEASTSENLISHIDRVLDEADIVLAASPDPEKPGKIMAPPDEVLEHLYGTADVTLIEADGSRRMPLKWPAPWEPVIPERTDITVCVAGLSAVGKRPGDVVYRAVELPENIKGTSADVNFLHKLISSSEGGRKGVRGEFRVFLNQVDDDIDRLAAAYRLQQILSVMGIQTAWGSLLPADDLAACVGHQIKIAVILEAAGNSTRFGSNKLMHIMDDGRPMAACIMDAVSEAAGIIAGRPGSVRLSLKKILVTQYDEVAALAPDFEIVMNDRPDLGISHSMQLGIEAADDADAYMFCVCDQPGLRASTLVRLIDAYADPAHDPSKKETAGIVSLAWQGEMCNPKIFSSKYRNDLLDLRGDTGGRRIADAHRDDLVLIEASFIEETCDMDSPDDQLSTVCP